MIDLRLGDSLDVMRALPDASVDAVVTDPPAGIGFMGKVFDHNRGGRVQWVAWLSERLTEARRVSKPGAYMLCWALPRTSHWTGTAIEDAGWVIRDVIVHLTGQGFPKGLNVSKALSDKNLSCQCRTDAVQCADAKTITNLPDVRAAIPPEIAEGSGEVPVLLGGLLRQVAGNGPDNSRPTQGDSAQGAKGLDGDLPRLVPVQDERGEQPGVEGRGDVQEEQGELRRPEVRPVPGGPLANGPVGRLRDEAPGGHGSDGTPAVESNGSRSLSRPRHPEQRSRQPRTLAEQRDPQGGGAWPDCDRCGKPVVPDGLNTALKPAAEHWILAQNPIDGTIAGNVLRHGTGALNIDDCRIPGKWTTWQAQRGDPIPANIPAQNSVGWGNGYVATEHPSGRWPANLTHDGSPEVMEAFAAFGEKTSGKAGVNGHRRNARDVGGIYGGGDGLFTEAGDAGELYGDTGSAARFFYCAKASRSERGGGNTHPTVKSQALMRWLCRLITPPGGVVLDCFAGSGSTLLAADAEGFDSIGIEQNPEYVGIIRSRLAALRAATPLFREALA